MKKDMNTNAVVSYNAGMMQANGTAFDLTAFNHYWTNWEPLVYPSHTHVTYGSTMSSKLELAFKIVSKLLEKEYIKELTVKDFILLVNEVSGLI